MVFPPLWGPTCTALLHVVLSQLPLRPSQPLPTLVLSLCTPNPCCSGGARHSDGSQHVFIPLGGSTWSRMGCLRHLFCSGYVHLLGHTAVSMTDLCGPVLPQCPAAAGSPSILLLHRLQAVPAMLGRKKVASLGLFTEVMPSAAACQQHVLWHFTKTEAETKLFSGWQCLRQEQC